VRKLLVTLRTTSLVVAVSAAMVASAAPALGVSASPAGGQGAPYARSAAPSGAQAHLTLPVPAGHYPVGTVSMDLIDRGRANPWASSPRYRRPMVSIWYPAMGAQRYPAAPQMLPGAAAHFGSADGAAAQLYGAPPGSVAWAATLTGGHQGAPVAGHRALFPVVLYSPGLGEPRTWGTTLVQDLASRGYVVVTIDHTYEASEVEFPGGRVIDSQLAAWAAQAQQNGTVLALLKKIVAVRVADVRSVINNLTALDAGRNPSAGHRPLPQGLAGALDLHRIGREVGPLGGVANPCCRAEAPEAIAAGAPDGSTHRPSGIPPAVPVHAMR